MTQRSLVVGVFDDDVTGCELMSRLAMSVARRIGASEDQVDVKKTQDPRDAEDIAESGVCDLVLTDLVWAVRGDRDPRVGLALAEAAKFANPRAVVVVITANEAQEKSFRTDAKARGASLAYTWSEAFAVGRPQTIREIADALRPLASAAIPGILQSTSETVGLVGLDVVGYSEGDDLKQLDMVRALLGYAREAWTQVPHSDIVPLFGFTGDGLLLGLGGSNGPTVAFDLAERIWRKMRDLAAFPVRLALHAGPVEVVEFDFGPKQMLGHSVNWLFRAVDCAEKGGWVVTEEYYQAYMQAGRRAHPGLNFTKKVYDIKHQRQMTLFGVSEQL